jgi:uncharacterized protein
MSRFQPIEFYQSQGKRYELLPFRFDRRGDGRTVVTNLVGEYIVVSDEVIDDLVSGRLPLNNAVASALRARQVLQLPGERAPKELLARKLRTKLRRLPEFTGLHIFVVTLRCEHSCPYCQVSRQSTDKAAFDMSFDTAERALAAVFRSPARNLKIEFQGGEPLLNFEMIQHVVRRAKEINSSANRELNFVIATNLALLDDNVLAFCEENHVYLSTSLDGPRDLHNANRPRPGKNSWDLVTANIKKIRERLGSDRVSALMTTTEASLADPHGIIDAYREQGFNSIFLRPLSPFGFAIKTKSYRAYNTERWLDFYREGLDYILDLNRKGIDFTEQYASLILRKMLTNDDPGYVDLMNPSGVGIAAVVYNYDGGVYASDEGRMLAEMGHERFRLGDLSTDRYEEILYSEALVEALDESFTSSVPGCSSCAYEPLCGADPVYHYATSGDLVGRKPESDFCRRNMTIFRLLIDLMESDAENRRILLGWAARG